MNKGAIQIGTAKETTVAQLARVIINISGKDIPVVFDTSKPEGEGGDPVTSRGQKTFSGGCFYIH
jgi:hypothetical protein